MVEETEFQKFDRVVVNGPNFGSYKSQWDVLSDQNKANLVLWFYHGKDDNIPNDLTRFMNENFQEFLVGLKRNRNRPGGSSRRRRPSRKYKKSSKRVFRKKSHSTRRR